MWVEDIKEVTYDQIYSYHGNRSIKHYKKLDLFSVGDLRIAPQCYKTLVVIVMVLKIDKSCNMTQHIEVCTFSVPVM